MVVIGARMQATTLLRKLLGIDQVVIDAVAAEDGSLVVRLRPRWRKPRCSQCRTPGRERHGKAVTRSWRDLDMGGVRVLLRCDLRRVACVECGAEGLEAVPWSADVTSKFTQRFEDRLEWMVEETDRAFVEELLSP